MLPDMTLIDPLSFFSAGGIVKVPSPPPPAVKRQLLEKENTPIPENQIKKSKTEKAARMPGVNAALAVEAKSPVHALWVEKYKPTKISDLVGNSQQVSKLTNWLRLWTASNTTSERAALISGPPGIGKSSTARLVSEELGFTVLEFNASDTRSKQAIDELTAGLSTNKVLFANGGASMGAKVAVIMDEVDGMAGSGDRGGSGALIQMIKKSKLPMICICNDRQDSKIRSLANHCLDLRFSRPTVQEVANRARVIACSEKLTLNSAQLLAIAESACCDMRQVINNLELGSTGVKDEAMDPFAVVKGLFTSSVARTWSYEKRNELFFIDYDFVPLLAQQNYLKAVDKVTDPRVLPAIRKACEFITSADVIGKAIHTDAHWGLLPEYGTLSTVAPSFACNNVLQFPDFPVWLGKQSSLGKNARLFKELRSMVGSFSTCTSRNLKLSRYSDVLYQSLTAKLASAGVKETIAMLDELGVPKDSLFEVLGETRLPWQTDPYAQIDSKTKAAFTRSYNAGSHLIKTGTGDMTVRAKKNHVPSKMGREDQDEQSEDETPEEPVMSVQRAKPKKRN